MRRLLVLAALLLPALAGCEVNVGGSDPGSSGVPGCSAATTHGRDESRGGLILMAQSVHSASLVPCIRSLPVGWSYTMLRVSSKAARFWLGYDRSGDRALEVSVGGSCDLTGAVESTSPRAGVRRFDHVDEAPSRYRGERYFTFAGGCVRYRFDLHGPAGPAQADAVSAGLDFARRADLARSVHEFSHGRYELDAPPGGGGR